MWDPINARRSRSFHRSTPESSQSDSFQPCTVSSRSLAIAGGMFSFRCDDRNQNVEARAFVASTSGTVLDDSDHKS